MFLPIFTVSYEFGSYIILHTQRVIALCTQLSALSYKHLIRSLSCQVSLCDLSQCGAGIQLSTYILIMYLNDCQLKMYTITSASDSKITTMQSTKLSLICMQYILRNFFTAIQNG